MKTYQYQRTFWKFPPHKFDEHLKFKKMFANISKLMPFCLYS